MPATQALKQAQENLRAAQQRQADSANLHRREHTFKVGDEVRLSTVNLRKNASGLARKLLPKFVGPCSVRRILSPVAVELDLPPELSRIHPVFHTSLLLPYERRVSPDPNFEPSAPEELSPPAR